MDFSAWLAKILQSLGISLGDLLSFMHYSMYAFATAFLLTAAVGTGMAVFNVIYKNNRRAIIGVASAALGFGLCWIMDALGATPGSEPLVRSALILSSLVGFGLLLGGTAKGQTAH